MTRHLINALRRRARQLDSTEVRYGSIEGAAGWNTMYTPGVKGGWTGPERWSVTRAGAYVRKS